METAATKVGEEIVTGVVAQIKHQFNYLSHYHDNIQNLSSKVETLKSKRHRVVERVGEAGRNNQDIEDDVKKWLDKVKVIEAAAEGTLKDKDKVGNGCWKGWCLNLKSRYQLSRKAMKKAPDLDALLAECEFETVARPQRPLGLVRELTLSSEITEATSDSRKTQQVVEIQGDEKSKDASYTAQHLLGIASSSTGARGGLESRTLILTNVMEAVKDDQIRIIRICGMGGVGKTTMAKEVMKLASEERLFHEIAMVEFNQEPDLKSIQLHIAELLGLELKEDSLSTRADRLRQRLNKENKRILVILDNVWKREDVEKVGIPFGDHHSHCKILLTSRLNIVCKNIAPEKEFNIEVLSDLEARILFRQSLGNSPCYETAEELVSACAGLPIAIKTIARAVANKSENAWSVAVEELQKSALEGEYPAVFNCLKVSYEFLNDAKIKKFFRLCCLFPKGSNVPIEYLTRYGMALRLFKDVDKLYKARQKAHVNIETLLQSNLLLASDEIECVKMHDLVWDFALTIPSEDLFMVNCGDELDEWPRRDSYEDYTSISLQCDKMHELPDGLNFRNLEILQLVGKWWSSLKVPENFYKEMAGLHVLALFEMSVPLTLKSLQHLANLRTLCLDRCRLNIDVSMIGNLDKLEVLSFAYSNMEELPTEIGRLRGLRLLDLTGCGLRIIAPGVLSGLSCLEELYMKGNKWHMEEFQATVTEISSLPKLLVIVIEIEYRFLPIDSSFSFKKVEKFMIANGCTLESKDAYLFQNTLKVVCGTNVQLGCGIKVLLGKTEAMHLEGGDLKSLLNESETETGDFLKLKTLSLKSCDELVYLVNTTRLHQNNVFPQLNSLFLYDLYNLEDIYHVRNSEESFGELTGVEIMAHSWMVPAQFASFGRLTVLDVIYCNKLESIFPLSIARGLVMLKWLKITYCNMLKEIFRKDRGDEDEKASVCNIEFPNLKYLSLHGLPNLVGFCKASVELPQLEELKLSSLPKLTSLCFNTKNSGSYPLFNHKGPHTTWGYQNLTSLKISYCDGLRQLFTPSVAISFGELQRLDVEWCKSLEAIVAAEGREEAKEDCAMEEIIFPKLNHLVLEELPNLYAIMPKGYTFRWSSLKKMRVDNCGGQSDIFAIANMNSIQKGSTGQKMLLTSLEDMRIERTNSTELWRNHFPSGCSYELRNMAFRGCNTVSVLFSSQLVRGCHHLKKLELRQCNSLEVVFDLEELIVGGEHKLVILNQLDNMDFHNLPRMTHIWKKAPQSFEGFHNLTKLEVKDCDSLRYLFLPLIARCLVKLRNVTIENCGVMEEVVSRRDEGADQENAVDDMIFFPELEQLKLVNLPSLLSLGPGAYAFDKPSLGAPNETSSETHHEGNANTSISSPIFNGKIALTSLEDVEIKKTNSTECWRDHFAGRCSYKRRTIVLSSCNKPLVLFSSHLVRGCHHLKKLKLRNCNSLEVVFDLEELIVGGEHKLVILSRLDNMGLYNLPRMTHVWKRVPKSFKGFHNLTSLKVKDCDSLRYLFSPLIARCLVKLRRVLIEKCEAMEEVVSRRDEGEDQKNEVDMIFFPKLEQLKLVDLPSLISIVPGAYAFDKLSLGAPNDASSDTHHEGNANTAISSPIFNEKVFIYMHFNGLHTIRGFQNLTSLIVKNCSSLRHLFTPSVAISFGELQHLEVEWCTSLQAIVAAEGGEEEEDCAMEGILFPKLTNLLLTELPSMSTIMPKGYSFRWSSLKKMKVENWGTTGQKIVLTSLEDMEIVATNSTELWRNHFPGGCSYELRNMASHSCNTLSVLSSHFVRGCHHLEKLELRNCNSLEMVFDLEELIVGGEHQLGILNRLDGLELYNLPRMTHVWKKVPKSFEGFHNLTKLQVYYCDSLRYLFSPLIDRCLVNLRRVLIQNCKAMEEIVSRRDEGAYQENTVDMIFFPEWHELILWDLPSLISFGPGAYAFEKPSLEAPNDASSETQPIGKSSNPSSALVTLEGIGRCQLPTWSFHNLISVYVHECHKLLYVFPPNIVVRLPVLKFLSVEKCDSLRYLFYPSTVTSLERLISLKISGCDMMEVIVKDEDEEEADRMSKLVLPSLVSITLKSLPNLRGFCLGVLGFEWRSLMLVEIEFCWQMGIFTSGYSSTPLLDNVLINSNKHSLEGDLNTTLLSMQQKDRDNLAFKEEGILTINGFLVAGDHLVAQCPSWSWQSGEPGKENYYLPAERQFLITRNVPCLRRASSTVVEDKIEADECADDKIPRPRTYDVSITYDTFYKTPRLWLKGYDESKMPLPLELVLEDIAEHHPRHLVANCDHPHLAATHVSLYEGLRPSFIKNISDDQTLRGFQPSVHHYMQLLLDFLAPSLPTIQYCFC